MKKLSIVIPVYNSQNTIKEVINRIEKAVLKLENITLADIVLVNDYSKDNSLTVCKEICQEKKYIKLLSFSKNFGQHHGLIAGLKYTIGDYIICLDDDLQTPPEEIEKLINKLETENLDVVFAEYETKKHSMFRNIGSYINDFMATYLINKPKCVKMSSFFITKKFIIDEIIKYNNPYPYIGGLIFRATQNVGNVIIKHNERKEGSSNYTLTKLFRLWLNGFTNFSVRPLRFSSIMGFVFSVLSFIWMIYIILNKFLNPEVQIGWTSLMVMIAFFGGIQLITIGLLGEYVGRIYLSINKTPQYVVKEAYNIKGNEDENE